MTFDFAQPRNLGVFTCKRVLDGAPIVRVTHDKDGDWSFLCDGDHDDATVDRLLIMGLEEIVTRDPTLNQLASLGCSERAERSAPTEPWAIVDESEEFIRHHVATTGWAVEYVLAGDDEAPSFAYTVGLYRNFGHPEIILFGLQPDVAQGVLNGCGHRVAGGVSLPLDTEVSDVLDDYPVRFRAVNDTASYQAHVTYALWFYDGAPFPLVQLVWPTKSGCFPDAPDAEPWFRQLQPLLP